MSTRKAYDAGVAKAERERVLMALDALERFSVELVDPNDEDGFLPMNVVKAEQLDALIAKLRSKP